MCDSAQTFKVKLLLSRLFPVWLRRRRCGSDAAVGSADLTLSLWRRRAADSNGAISQPLLSHPHSLSSVLQFGTEELLRA